MNQSEKHRFIIGKSDIADFPTFNLNNVKVKIDTGAYTSTIHCSEINITKNGLDVVFLDKTETGFTGEAINFKNFKKRKVRSSNGKLQDRFSVRGDIILFQKKINAEFTLSKRNFMKYPVLLGRKLLSNRFIIDTTLLNESYKQKNKDVNEDRSFKPK